MEIKAFTYEELEKCFNKLDARSYELKQNLMRAIAEMQAREISVSRSSNYYNVLEVQERSEREKIGESKLRFYKPYYNQIPNISTPINGSVIRNYRMPNQLSTDVRIAKPSREEYMKMSESEKKEICAQVLRELAVVYARNANAQNRRKDEYGAKIDQCYTKKDLYMNYFLRFAHLYNSQVQESEQIYFGFEIDTTNNFPVLTASLPGCTRLSLHMGKRSVYEELLRDVNKYCLKMGLPEFPLEVQRLCGQYPYQLNQGSLYEKNTGLINFGDEDSKEYQQQIRQQSGADSKKVNSEGMKQFSLFMYPDLNIREVLYLAELAGLGKEYLIKFQDLEKRKADIKRRTINNNSIRKLYLKHKLGKAEEKCDKVKVLKDFWEIYQTILNKDGEKPYVSESFAGYFDLIYDLGIDQEILKEFTEDTIKTMDDGEMPDLVAEANISTIRNILSTVDNSQREEILEIIQLEAESRPELSEIFLDNSQERTNDIYGQIKGITKNIGPKEREEAEKIEQTLLELIAQIDT